MGKNPHDVCLKLLLKQKKIACLMGSASSMFVSVWYDKNVVNNKLNIKINA